MRDFTPFLKTVHYIINLKKNSIFFIHVLLQNALAFSVETVTISDL